MQNKEREVEKRFHIYLCITAVEALHRIWLNMGYIEDDLTKRYGRTDSLALKTYNIRINIENVESAINKIAEESKTKGG